MGMYFLFNATTMKYAYGIKWKVFQSTFSTKAITFSSSGQNCISRMKSCFLTGDKLQSIEFDTNTHRDRWSGYKVSLAQKLLSYYKGKLLENITKFADPSVSD